MLTVLQGAVIVKVKGQNIFYNRKCAKCGFENVSTTSTVVPSYSKSVSTFKCPKCHHRQTVEIEG